MCTYVSLIADEVAQVAVLHVGQNHERRALWWQADSQQRENVRVAEVLHDDPLLQELGHLFQICDAFMENKAEQNQNVNISLKSKMRLFSSSSSRRMFDLHCV